MASPQLENGYTKIADEIFEKIALFPDLSASMYRILLVVWRQTYGWNKKEDAISISQFMKRTHLSRRAVIYALQELEAKRILIIKRERSGRLMETNIIGFNKNHDQWLIGKSSAQVEKNRGSAKLRKGSAKPGKLVVQNSVCNLPSFAPTIDTCPTDIFTKDTTSEQSSQGLPTDKQKEDMSNFKRVGDDYEEGYVDFDGSTSLLGEKKKSTAKYPNAPAVRKLFLEILGKSPADWRTNKTVLQACENLYTERGLDKIRNALEFYADHMDDKFCPKIYTPVDLDRKYQQLADYKLSL